MKLAKIIIGAAVILALLGAAKGCEGHSRPNPGVPATYDK